MSALNTPQLPDVWAGVNSTLEKLIDAMNQRNKLMDEMLIILLESELCCPVVLTEENIYDWHGFVSGVIYDLTLKTDCGDFVCRIESKNDRFGLSANKRLREIIETFGNAIRA